VRKLRQKLEKASPGWRYIHTHFGVGYRFSPEPAVAEGTVPEPETTVAPMPAPARADDVPGAPAENAAVS
jgi:hypothetical protein